MTQPASTAPRTPVLQRRVGPFPLWLLFLVFVLAVAGFIWFRRTRKPSDDSDGLTGGVLTQDQPTILPFFPQELEVTIVRDEPPQSDTPPPPNVDVPPVIPPPKPQPPPSPTPKPPPAPTPKPAPKPSPAPAPKGEFVTVTKYTSSNPPWNSTIWGIWNRFRSQGKTVAANWQAVWNHAQNAALRNMRGRPENIRVGDKVWVPR